MFKLMPRIYHEGGQRILLLTSSLGPLVIGGPDPWARFELLKPLDRILGAAENVEQRLLLRVTYVEAPIAARALRRATQAVWPPLKPQNVGLLTPDGCVVTGKTLAEVCRLVGIADWRSVGRFWLSGESFKGFYPFSAHTREAAPKQ